MHQIVCAKPYRSCLLVALYSKTNLRVRARVEHGSWVSCFKYLISIAYSAVEHLARLFHGKTPRHHDFRNGTLIPAYLSVFTAFFRHLMPPFIEIASSAFLSAVRMWYYTTVTGVCYA